MSIELEQIQAALARCGGGTQWELTRAELHSDTLHSPEALVARLQADPPQQGWVVAQSGHHLILRGELPPGRWLEGEWRAASGDAYQLRDQPGGWRLLRIHEGSGEPALACERLHLPDRGAPRPLVWRVFHRLQGLHCLPVFAAFRGFAAASTD